MYLSFDYNVENMFSYKGMVFTIFVLLFMILIPDVPFMQKGDFDYLVIISLIFLVILFLLYRLGVFDKEKITEKIVEKRERDEQKSNFQDVAKRSDVLKKEKM